MIITTIRLVLCMVVAENLLLEQIVMEIVFLHGDLENDIYIKQLQRFVSQSNNEFLCKLRKSLYGLK